MKKSSLLLLNVLFSFLIVACNSCQIVNTNLNTMFIIPQNKKSLICKIENNQVIEIGSVPISNDSKSIIVNDEFICTIDSKISIYDIKGNLVKQIVGDFKPTSLNSKNKVIYLGGKSERFNNESGEIFTYIDLDKKDFELNKVKLPIEISYGKAIDDILLLNNKLILVDNLVFPKYLLEYDISNPSNPKHTKTKELKNNGTYEHIIKGDVNDNWLVLFSTTTGMYGSSDHIIIEGKSNGYLSTHRDFDKGGNNVKSQKSKIKKFKDICLIDNLLYILIDNSLYCIDLNGPILEKNLKKVDSEINEIQKLIKTPNNKIIASGNEKYELIK